MWSGSEGQDEMFGGGSLSNMGLAKSCDSSLVNNWIVMKRCGSCKGNAGEDLCACERGKTPQKKRQHNVR